MSANRLELQSPTIFRFDYLKRITQQFSSELILGRGGFGTVYKGEDNDKCIAVKMLHQTEATAIDDKKFKNEVLNVMHISHPNIVRLEGYCIHKDKEQITHKGTQVTAQNQIRLICFEYLPNGSLQKYLKNDTDKCRVLNWNERYNIIKGICTGLHYLHEERGGEQHILHLDLKPANVLLDKNMMPKIADFGQSRLRLLNDETHTMKLEGTCGYMPIEYIDQGTISKKTDIYSLGVIVMEIIAGERKYPGYQLDEVRKKWKETPGSEEYEQKEKCIKLALDCMEKDPRKRPDIKQVIEILGISEDDTNPDGIIEEHSVENIDSNEVDEERHGLLRKRTDKSNSQLEILESGTTPAVTVRTRLQRMKNSAFLSGVHIPIIGLLVSGGILFSVLIYSVRPYIAPSSHAKSRTVNITVEEATFRLAVATSSPAAVLTYNFSVKMDINYVYGSYRPSATTLFDVYFSFAGQRFVVDDESVPTALSRTLVIGPVSGNQMLGTAAVDEYLKAANMTTSKVVFSTIEVELAVLASVRYDDPALTVCNLVAKCPFRLPLWAIGVGLESTFYDVKCSLDMGWSSTKDTKTTVIPKPTFTVRGRSKWDDEMLTEARARARVRAKREARWAAAPP